MALGGGACAATNVSSIVAARTHRHTKNESHGRGFMWRRFWQGLAGESYTEHSASKGRLEIGRQPGEIDERTSARSLGKLPSASVISSDIKLAKSDKGGRRTRTDVNGVSG
jgi:hypothetical protein